MSDRSPLIGVPDSVPADELSMFREWQTAIQNPSNYLNAHVQLQSLKRTDDPAVASFATAQEDALEARAAATQTMPAYLAARGIAALSRMTRLADADEVSDMISNANRIPFTDAQARSLKEFSWQAALKHTAPNDPLRIEALEGRADMIATKSGTTLAQANQAVAAMEVASDYMKGTMAYGAGSVQHDHNAFRVAIVNQRLQDVVLDALATSPRKLLQEDRVDLANAAAKYFKTANHAQQERFLLVLTEIYEANPEAVARGALHDAGLAMAASEKRGVLNPFQVKLAELILHAELVPAAVKTPEAAQSFLSSLTPQYPALAPFAQHESHEFGIWPTAKRSLAAHQPRVAALLQTLGMTIETDSIAAEAETLRTRLPINRTGRGPNQTHS